MGAVSWLKYRISEISILLVKAGQNERKTVTVNPRLSGHVGTSVNSPDNPKYEY